MTDTSLPAVQSLERVGVIDVGSNSVRFVVFDGAARCPAYFYNEKVMCGLGAGLRDSGILNPEGRGRALRALDRFQTLANTMNLPPLSTVATAAVRDAQDGPEFCDEVAAHTGLRLNVIDGAEEARLSAQGVLLGWPDATGIVCDIGGASMELALVQKGEIGDRVTSDLGPLKLEGFSGKAKLRAHIRAILSELFETLGCPKGQRLYLVGGSWRAFARVDMDRRGYPLHVLHEYRMLSADIRRSYDIITHSNLDALRERCGISASRADLLPLAGLVLRELSRIFAPKEIVVSGFGIREGMLFEQMSKKLRRKDPLLEAAQFLEIKDARIPGFGATLFDFVKPLFPRLPASQERLTQVACLLHDVNWRAHPDFRADVCFETATRAHLCGLTHAERIQLGLALTYRYSRRGPSDRFKPYLKLLDDKHKHAAEVLGKAMRLGAMLWHHPDQNAASLNWRRGKGHLEIRLEPDAQALFGEVAQARFTSLADALGAQGIRR